jgi:hypothetical protein
MKRIIHIALIIVVLYLIPSYSSSALIYDEDKGLIYLGGYPIEGLRRDIGNKEDRYLKDKIYVLNFKENTSKLLISGEEPIVDLVYSVGGYILVSTNKQDQTKGEYVGKIIIYTDRGEQKRTIDNVPIIADEEVFSLSIDGNKIVYISGRAIIEGRERFITEGVWTYDIENDETKKIADQGIQVNWSRHDNNIYIQNKFDTKDPSDISVYNTSTGELSKSDRKGIIFSDDGKYCIGAELIKGFGGDHPTFKYYIFNNISNQKIYKFKEEWGVQYEMTQNVKFIYGSPYLLMWGTKSYKIFDVKSQSFIRAGKRKGLIGWNEDMTKVVVYGGGDQIHIDVLMTGKRLKSIDIPK